MNYEFLEELTQKVKDSNISKKEKDIFKNCLYNTFTKTIKEIDDDNIYVITGDIEAMWLRDSTMQILPLMYVDDKKALDIVRRVINRQFFYLNIDSYANAFNESANARHWADDDNDICDWVWERKYEIDSIALPMWLLNKYYYRTFDKKTLLDKKEIIEKLIKQIKLEQNHDNSSYLFIRNNDWKMDQLENNGKGSKVSYTKMSWQAFRPNDDVCKYHYNIPGNLLISKALEDASEIWKEFDIDLSNSMLNLSKEIREGIEEFGTYNHEKYGKIYAYEVDGLGNYELIDDANMPSLLSMPFFGIDNEIIRNTRKFILSKDNRYFYEGEYFYGIGSSHTPEGYIWHLAIANELLTSNDIEDKEKLLKLMADSDADTGLMHESFYKDNPKEYTREFFSWANSMYFLSVLDLITQKIDKK